VKSHKMSNPGPIHDGADNQDRRQSQPEKKEPPDGPQTPRPSGRERYVVVDLLYVRLDDFSQLGKRFL